MKLLKLLALAVVLIFCLMIFSSVIHYYSKGGKEMAFLSKPLLDFATFPYTIYRAVNSSTVTGIPDTYVIKDPNFKEKNSLKNDLFAVNSFWIDDQWEIRLLNLKNDSILHTWRIEEKSEAFKPEKPIFSNKLPRHSLILKNYDLIAQLAVSPNLMRLDSLSNIIWHNQDMFYHHSINYDADSNIWVCAFPRSPDYQWYRDNGRVEIFDGSIVHYDDDFIVKVNPSNGEILYKKSVSDILIQNGKQGLIFGESLYDVVHLNDIQPVIEDNIYWKKGDLFLSIRNKSIIILYRPSTNKIIRLIQGPFINQHDVDIISDKEISIFNNNAIFPWHYAESSNTKENVNHSIISSQILIYNFETDRFSEKFQHQMEKERIFTASEGLCEFLSDGSVYIESQNNGKLYIMNEDKILYKNTFDTNIRGYIHTPNWVRIYESLNF